MTKTEIARWLTPGLTPLRLVFTSYGGSTHGVVELEIKDQENSDWGHLRKISKANGIPETKGEKVSDVTINQFTGEKS
jgi:hypothetical protein